MLFYRKTMFVRVLFLVFICASLFFEKIHCAEDCAEECSVAENHLANGGRSVIELPGVGRTEIGSGGLYVHEDELSKPVSEMKIGLTVDDNPSQVRNIISSSDRLRKDNSLLMALNVYGARRSGGKEAVRRLYKFAFQGFPLSSHYSICSVGFLWFGSGFLCIRKSAPKKCIFDLLGYSATDGTKDAICAVAQGRDARYAVLSQMLDSGGLPVDLIRLIIEDFDENSPEELKTIKEEREKIRRERQNSTTCFKLAAVFEKLVENLK